LNRHSSPIVGKIEALHCNTMHDRHDAIISAMRGTSLHPGQGFVQSRFRAPLVIKRITVTHDEEEAGCSVRPNTVKEVREYLETVFNNSEPLTWLRESEREASRRQYESINWENITATVFCNWYNSDMVQLTIWHLEWCSASKCNEFWLLTEINSERSKAAMGVNNTLFAMQNRLKLTSTSHWGGWVQVEVDIVSRPLSLVLKQYYPDYPPPNAPYFHFDLECTEGVSYQQLIRSRLVNTVGAYILFWPSTYAVHRIYYPGNDSCEKFLTSMKLFGSTAAYVRKRSYPEKLLTLTGCWLHWLPDLFLWEIPPQVIMENGTSMLNTDFYSGQSKL